MTISKNPQKIKEMFNSIADRYDFNNNLISLGMHKLIKAQSIKNLDINSNAKILDVCCGTGDFIEIIHKNCSDIKITGVDFSDKMLAIAAKKTPYAELVHGDCTGLPFSDESFDIVTAGFGLRNIEDYRSALSEIYRVLKKDGQFLHLDFGQKNLPSKIFDIMVLPLIKIFYGKKMPYQYLLRSKEEFFTPEKLIEMFENHGFILKCRKDFLFGVISMQIMKKL